MPQPVSQTKLEAEVYVKQGSSLKLEAIFPPRSPQLPVHNVVLRVPQNAQGPLVGKCDAWECELRLCLVIDILQKRILPLRMH